MSATFLAASLIADYKRRIFLPAWCCNSQLKQFETRLRFGTCRRVQIFEYLRRSRSTTTRHAAHFFNTRPHENVAITKSADVSNSRRRLYSIILSTLIGGIRRCCSRLSVKYHSSSALIVFSWRRLDIIQTKIYARRAETRCAKVSK